MIEKLVLLDLDGVLTDTTEPVFKKFKDGLEKCDLNSIPMIDGAIDFIKRLKSNSGIKIAVISDSHPHYVQPIITEFFDVPFLALADKPNTSKTKTFLLNTFGEIKDFNRRAIMIGDSWLDIELARGLEIPSIYTKLYKFKTIDIRDDLGSHDRALKSGPTFEAGSFNEIEDILSQPKQKLLCLEAYFVKDKSSVSRELSLTEVCGKTKTVISLSRQQLGGCDRFVLLNIYNEFQKINRNPEVVSTLASGLNYFLAQFQSSITLNDPILSYIPEKSNTSNPKKMVEIWEKLDAIQSKESLFLWDGIINNSTKSYAHKYDRQKFLETHLQVKNESIDGRDVIVIDDQYTTGATAETSINKLWEKGAKNVYFITFFYLINLVVTDKVCPKCGKYFQIKVRKKDGAKFLSCASPEFGGIGCGNIQNL